MQEKNTYCIGVDFGTDSVRCLLVEAVTGRQIAQATAAYSRWKDGLYCDPAGARFRQHPLDYIECLESVIKEVLDQAGGGLGDQVVALSLATTGSTPAPVDRTGTPLALLPEFAQDPDAMFYLWKDHTAIREAEDINSYCREHRLPYLSEAGGLYSAEWFWSKLLHLKRKQSKAAAACYGWVEHADWMPFLLTGGTALSQLKRGICAAGHKALWSATWGGFPPNSFWEGVDPVLTGFVNRMDNKVYGNDEPAGNLSTNWAGRLGLSTRVKVGIGALDAHIAAVGGEIKPYYLSKVMGTSTCDMLVAPKGELGSKLVPGICGQVDGSILPGMIGMEAGQSAFGDVYAWFERFLSWPGSKSTGPIGSRGVEGADENLLTSLNEAASRLSPAELLEAPLSLDWFNGRRTPDVDPSVKAAVTGISLATTPELLFASLGEATCFGSKAIVDRFVQSGIPVEGIIGVGGIAHKSPFVMQMMASVLNRPIQVANSDQSCALGAAMYAATLGGLYPKIEDAMAGLGQGFSKTYLPDPVQVAMHQKRYIRYLKLGDFVSGEAND